jgi:hypothetical protein
MSFGEFYELFESALSIAVGNAEKRLHQRLPHEIIVELHGAGNTGKLMDPFQAAKVLYLGEDRYYRVIDIALIKVNKRESIVFVRASSHSPGTFAQTWNNPHGSGPFKQIMATEIEIEEAE